MLFVLVCSFPGMLQFAAPVTCWGKLSPWLCLHPVDVCAEAAAGGLVALQTWESPISKPKLLHSEHWLAWFVVCMHALRPINENKVITVCGRGSCRGSVWPQPEVLPKLQSVCRDQLGTQALLCHLLKRHSEGTFPPVPCFNMSQKKVSLPWLEFSPGASQARINCWPHKLFLLYWIFAD